MLFRRRHVEYTRTGAGTVTATPTGVSCESIAVRGSTCLLSLPGLWGHGTVPLHEAIKHDTECEKRSTKTLSEARDPLRGRLNREAGSAGTIPHFWASAVESGLSQANGSTCFIEGYHVTYRIVEDRCTLCGECLEECPMAAISVDAADRYVIDPDCCTDCGSCCDICPAGAITGA
jgi:NAD-dependent dihydropyrimidine dehydrogenase PreA subunit